VAITLGSIVVELLANTAGFQSGLNKASYEGKKAAKEIHQSFQEMGNKIGGSLSGALGSLGEFGSVAGELGAKLSEAFEGVGKSVGGIGASLSVIGALGAAAIGAASGLAIMAKEGAELTEHLSQVSQKTGISVHDLQTLEAAGKTVGIGLDDMVTAFRKFDQAITGNGKHAGAAASVLKQLGITARDNKEALLQAADAFKAMDDGPRKAADAVALFGKSGLNMIPFLNKGREGVLEFQDAVDTFGPKINKQGIQNTEAWKVSVEKLSLSWQNLAVTISDNVLPTLTKATEGMAGLLRGASVLTGASLTAIGALFSGKNVTGALAGYLAERTAETGTDADEEALKRKNEAISAFKQHYKEVYDLQKSGGKDQLALLQAQEAITAAIQQEDFKAASRIQETIPALQAAADAEKQRLDHAKQLAATYAAIEKGFAKGSPKPFLPTKKVDPSKGIEALFGPQAKNPFEGAPDFGSPQFADISHAMDGLVKDTSIGTNALNDFYSKWNQNSSGTVDSINAEYDAQLAHFQGLLALGEIGEEQAKDVYLKIQQERFDGLKRLREQNGTSTFKDAWADLFAQLAVSGKDFARSITQDIGGAIEQLNHSLAKMVATGQGLNLKQIGQSLTENITSSFIKKGESSLFGSLGGLFGLNSAKNDGSTQNLALWVQVAGSPLAAAGAGIGSLPLGGLGQTLLGNFGSGTTTPGSNGGGIGGFFGSALSGIGGFFSKFGGFLAGGGSTQPGRAYIVGEKQPELFVPHSAGTVVPSVPNGNSNYNNTTVIQNISTPDADSFKRSATQISSAMGAAASRGSQRNGR
jgi:hypothetical protein